MTFLRNMLVMVGVLAIIVLTLVFIVKPDFYKPLISKPAEEQTQVQPAKVFATLSASQSNLIPDKSLKTDQSASPELSKLLEIQQTGFPPRNIPYLAIINKEKNQVKYWKLSKDVRQVSVRSSPTVYDVQVKQPPPTPGVPYQVEIWVSREGDLNLEFDIGPAPTTPRT